MFVIIRVLYIPSLHVIGQCFETSNCSPPHPNNFPQLRLRFAQEPLHIFLARSSLSTRSTVILGLDQIMAKALHTYKNNIGELSIVLFCETIMLPDSVVIFTLFAKVEVIRIAFDGFFHPLC